jgi:hypothetical protein
MQLRTRISKWVFFLGLIGGVGTVVQYGFSRPVTASFAFLLCVPYLALELRAGMDRGSDHATGDGS